MLRYETSCEGTRLEHSQTKPLLFMFSVYSQQQQPSPPTGTKSGSSCGKAVLRSSVPAVGAAMAPATSSAMTAVAYSASAGDTVSAGGGSTSPAAGTGSLTRQALEVCCLEGCGLGWRVRPPLVRRSPWTVTAQRMRLCIEALGGAKVEKVYTLLDHHELAPCISYEVSIGDLHAGDECHVPVLIWLPALEAELPMMDVVRFSLQYVDAIKIDTKSCEVCAGVARPAAGAVADAVSLAPAPPLTLDRERNRVLVWEALNRAALRANSGNLDGACSLLADVEGMLATAPSTLASDPLSTRLLEVITSAMRRLGEVLNENRCRTGSSFLEHKTAALAQATNGGGSGSNHDSPVSVIVGGSAHADTRAALKPRTFAVSLPFSSLGAGATRADTNPIGAAASLNRHDGGGGGGSGSGSTTTMLIGPSAGGSGSSGGSGASGRMLIGGESLWKRALLLRDNADSAPLQPPLGAHMGGNGAEADSATPSSARALTLRHPPILAKAPPIRLLSSVSFAGGKRGRVSGALRARPRMQPPVLMPLHAPPLARDPSVSVVGPPLGITPPLPPPSTVVRGVQGSYEAWLCRLLRMPLRPLPLPDELIVHIFSFLEPSVLFHESLTLPSLIVDKTATTVRGHFTTISAALRAAQPGDRLIIRPGVYRESVRIEVPVMLLGSQGGSSGVTITSSRNHTVHSVAPFARLENVTLRQTGSSGRSCLLVSRGRLEVSECDISSTSGLCVEVTDTAAPIVRHSRIHGGAAAGLWFRAGGCGLVEGNEIWGNGWSGVQISDESNPILLRNFIHDNKSAGVISFNHGRGVARHNDITSNGKGGVQVRSRACPELVCNRIFAERSFGVWVYEHGLGRFEDNDIVNNAWSGFQVEEGSAPIVVGNRLRGNRSAGIVVYNRGSGTYEWNDISCNGRCGVQIKSGSSPYFRHNRIHHEKQAGVLTAEDGTGVLEDNDIFDNAWSGVQTEGPSNPLLRHNRIHHNGGAGFIAYQNGSGLLESNNIYDNKKYGVQSKTGGHPTVRLNRIHDKVYGIYLTESGGGVYEENKIYNSRGSGIYVSSDCSPVLTNNHAA